MFTFNNDWNELLQTFCRSEKMQELEVNINKYFSNTDKIYPPKNLIFNALNKTSFADVKAVILGQDPYHQKGQAHGLSFSVPNGIPLPPSLKNIFKELADDINCMIPSSGCLEPWARQGVLLLNTTLTVVDSQPLSHNNLGWELFTTEVIRLLMSKKTPVSFILWGGHAKRKVHNLLKNSNDYSHHLFLESAHPSPLSSYRGFFGSKPFSQTNSFLEKNGMTPIQWSF